MEHNAHRQRFYFPINSGELRHFSGRVSVPYFIAMPRHGVPPDLVKASESVLVIICAIGFGPFASHAVLFLTFLVLRGTTPF